MYDDSILEVSKSRQADIRREIEKARWGMAADGATMKANRALPTWVDRLLHRKPFASEGQTTTGTGQQTSSHLN